MTAQLLWRSVLGTTIRAFAGRNTGQFHVSLSKRTAELERFLDGLPRSDVTAKGGYDVIVPLAPVPPPLDVPASSVMVSYIGPGGRRADWRIRSPQRDNAYPLWRPVPGARPGEDFMVMLRDPGGAFHARWLRGGQLAELPALAATLRRRGAGAIELDDATWEALARMLVVPLAPSPAAAGPSPTTAIGKPYQPEDESTVSARREPFAVDPDRVDRGTRAHRRTQNLLARHLGQAGLVPRSPRAGEPPFDIAWDDGEGAVVVAEVKSLTSSNEERQLRLGLGQVLRYAHLLRAANAGEVRPALVVEREPADPTWPELCAALGVRLAWPATFGDLTS